MIEASKLSVFFEFLIENHNLRTVLASTALNVEPRSGNMINNFATINMWFERLSERYNFSLGPNGGEGRPNYPGAISNNSITFKMKIPLFYVFISFNFS